MTLPNVFNFAALIKLSRTIFLPPARSRESIAGAQTFGVRPFFSVKFRVRLDSALSFNDISSCYTTLNDFDPRRATGVDIWSTDGRRAPIPTIWVVRA